MLTSFRSTLRFVKHYRANVLILGLLTILYLPILEYWLMGWLQKSISTEHEYFSYALLGFPYAAYIIFGQNRTAWEKLGDRADLVGIICLLVGSVFYLAGAVTFVNLSFPLVLTGVMGCLKGLSGIKLNAFPLLLIALATPNPLPYLLVPFTLPLQQFIAAFCGFLLMNMGVKVTVENIFLLVNDKLVEVAPYCAGLKMWFTSLYVALILVHWSGQLHRRDRLMILLAGATFLSLLANIIRNTLLSLFHGTGNQAAFESLHAGLGGDIYSLVLLLSIVALNQLMIHRNRQWQNWQDLSLGETGEENG
jgi:cyanoexosortase B